ncbi:glutamate--tRNA ligase family protein [Mucilaginibacter terrae]|uniref:Glutamyl/glutaminyl-tRNA synthetase n=1 Tax=Mucilaginibacter terrae TaxID=1955052 RepID=A0ABU3H0I1_9SPHI|nr:glutamate--tRNA ligase family protein [Mucilaginibacter terrae]MDT3405526.1 glutamyl/glutaminyl-tRNA synthetase [Mucilaginibacter terrae]
MISSNIYPQLNKTRLAPTPSGYLHLGNVLSFIITATLAQKCGAGILLRIDDMDRERVRDEYLQDIFDTLNFLEIPYTEGPKDVQDFKDSWSQLHRMDAYNAALEQLKEQGDVFACRCSRAQLQQYADAGYPGTCLPLHISLNNKNISWRLNTAKDQLTSINIFPGYIQQEVLPPDMQNFVIRKKDGYPAYQLSSLCDDIHYGVDLIVRGQDLWASTIAQQYLAGRLGAEGFNKAVFYHHPLIKDSSGGKLSKSMGSTSIKFMREQGYKPSAVFSQIAAHIGLKGNFNNWQQLGDACFEIYSTT